MGKFRSKLKGQTKGKRWPKGHSSVSNPETRRHRDAARSGFFQQNAGPSNLTLDALQKHNSVQSWMGKPSAQSTHSEDETMESQSMASSYQTMQSFASDWSGCTNMSYQRFLNVFRSDSALHKEMLAILSAVTEVIKENGGSETPVEYYCALLTTLEQVMSGEDKKEEQVAAVLSLINMGIKSVPQGVLRLHFGETSKKLMQVLNEYVSTENNAIMKAVFGIMSAILRAQDLATWSQLNTQQIFNALLNPFCIHSKPRFRKAAQQAVIGIVKANAFVDKATTNPPADKVAEFCEEVLNTCMGSNSNTVVVSTIQTSQTTINHVLGLIKETICNYSKAHIKNCSEIALRLIKLNYPLVTSCSLQVLYNLFSAQNATVSAKLNAQIVSALYECQPNSRDVQPTLAWLLVMQQAHVHLSDVDLSMSALALPVVFSNISNLWLSEKPEVIGAATRSLEVILQDALGPVVATPELVAQHKSKIESCISSVEQGLGYQYNSAWHNVLYTIKTMFEVCGVTCYNMLTNCLKSLSELRDSYKFSYNTELEHAVGAAVRSMGPENVLKVISITKDNGDLNIDRSWMIPVLKENTKKSSLGYFVNGILPLAVFCQRKSMELSQMNDGIRSHSYELFYNQLWNLLPSFCNAPTDIKANFKGIAKVMGTAIADRKELRLSVMASLRKLIMSARQAEDKDDLAELGRFDKNYLPILFNVYTTKPLGSDEEGQRLAALDTIKVYLLIARPEIVDSLFKSAIARIDTEEDSFVKESVLDLIRVLVPYINTECLQMLFDKCVKVLPTIKENKEQKKAYRILEVICSTDSETCKTFIKGNCKVVQKLLLKSLNSAAVSSKGARLRCLNFLVVAQPHLQHDSVLLKAVIPEAVLCCKDINEKCRNAAHQLIYTVGETLQAHDQMEQYIGLLVTGLTGTQQIMSCTILAVASALHHFTGALGIQNIKVLLENIANLMTSPTREVVSSCLSFLKVYLKAMPNAEVASSIPVIMKGLTSMTDDCQRAYRTKVRDILDRLIRKYGSESLTPHIPHSDTVMYKRLRNLKKLNARKKKQKEASKNGDDSEEEDQEEFLVQSKPKSIEAILADSDSELDEMVVDSNNVKSKNKKSSAWIEEGDDIVDLIDNKSRSKIMATKPVESLATAGAKEKKKDRGLKTASDGRLIITEDSSDSETEQKKSGKINFGSDSSDISDDDNDGDTRILTNRKRKRSDTTSMKSGFSGTSSIASSKYQAGGKGIHRPLGKKQMKDDGSYYKAKKGKGDAKKKGKVDPYAYLPLQRSALNKRMKAKNSGRFKNNFNTGHKKAKKN